ncbi:uncharacterized protein LOC134209085 [Armigeres subalbatus]|uniref:uncharacterized protein LOC134209085 n=1 Tax=Armigeres subalbatus TaxID=124917 RepID=UPI002ED4589A
METLRRLYGRPELLEKNLLGKVRRLEPPKPERLDTLINFGMAVQQLCDHLEAVLSRQSECKSRFHCSVGDCRQRHHPLLHPIESSPATRAQVQAHTSVRRSVLFRIVPITLYYGDRSFDTYGFLDEGSSFALVEVSVAHKLGVVGVPEPLELAWTSNVVRKEKSSLRIDLMNSGRGETERFKLSSAHTVNALSLPKQSLPFHEMAERLTHLHDLPILSYVDAEPKELIGLQNLELFVPLENRIGQPGEPIAETNRFVGHVRRYDGDRELNEIIRQRFALEDIEACAMLLESAKVKRARELLEQTTSRKDCRFVTGLLWKEDHVRLPNSLPMALRRMKSLEAKLARDPDLRDNVHHQIQEYIEKYYALAVADPNRIWYLPLNVVTHPKKPEKKRLVWDAAAQVNGVSLNSLLLKGPDLLVQLLHVISKFRERRVGFGGDIEKMFHQLTMIPADMHSQRFLFRFPSRPLDTYLMTFATFGSNMLSMLRAVRDAAEAIKQKTYMDDYFDSADTSQEAAERAQQVKFIHSQAGFNMRSWVSNSVEVLHSLGETPKQSLRPLSSNQSEDRERVLGMLWDPINDCFLFSDNWQEELTPYVCENRRPTKRIALRCIMSLFDPLGLMAPLLIHGRMLIQDMWRSGMAWDEDVPDEVIRKWQQWTGLLPMAYQLKIPRCYFGDADPCSYRTLQLHVFMFTDASENGFGCAAYFRIVEKQGSAFEIPIYCTVGTTGALIGARLMNSVCESHTLKIDQKFLWTDSSTVLAWIRSEHRRYKQYVAHRFGEILTLSEPENWRWVPSKENVANCLTKWTKDTEPSYSGKWLNGPSFLYHLEREWPEQRHSAETNEELRSHVLLHRVTIPKNLVEAGRIPKWNVLVRTIAFVHRFITNCRRRLQGHPIETVGATAAQEKLLIKPIPAKLIPLCQQEYVKAEMCLWPDAQSESYPDEMRVLLNNWNKPTEELLNVEKSSVREAV